MLLTSHRARTLAKLSLAFAEVTGRHPRLCQTDPVGHGGGGVDLPGHDPPYRAAAGLLDRPRMPLAPPADLLAAERTATATFAALLSRSRGGVGVRFEVAIAEAAGELAMPLRHGLTGAGGALDGAHPLYAVYAAAEGHVALAALEPRFGARLAGLLDVQDAAADPARLRGALEAAFRARAAEAWEDWALSNDVPLAAVRASGRGDPAR